MQINEVNELLKKYKEEIPYFRLRQLSDKFRQNPKLNINDIENILTKEAANYHIKQRRHIVVFKGSRNYIDKSCKFCGNEFKSNDKKRFYCSINCLRNAQKTHRKRFNEKQKKKSYSCLRR